MKIVTLYVLVFLGSAVLLFSGCGKDTPSLEPGPGADTNNPTTTKTYYVSATLGSDNNNGLSATYPFKTLNKAAGLTNPGDVVLLMNGTFTTTNGTALNITRSGTASNYITFKAYSGAKPVIAASGNVWNAVMINGSYVKVEGIEVMGNNQNLSLAAADASFNDYYNGGGVRGTNYELYAPYNTNGITVGGSKTESKKPHHVEVRNCTVHDMPGAGINLNQADYVIFEGNTVYNNSWFTMFGTSGISTIYPTNFDSSTGYKIIIRNNIVYGNKTMVKWVDKPNGPNYSDGNGIIIDLNQGKSGSAIYTGRTLVENNISYLNGGSGIHSLADHTDIINNIAYKNGQAVTNYANIYAGWCKDVKIINNIMYAKSGGRVNSTANNSTTNVTYDYNVYYYTTSGSDVLPITGAHFKVVDPLFVNPDAGNFMLQETSQAIDAGTPTATYSAKDYNGVTRPKGLAVDCGAFEIK